MTLKHACLGSWVGDIILHMSNYRTLPPAVVASVRSGVVCSLAAAVADLDESLALTIPAGRSSLLLSGPGGIARRLLFTDGQIKETKPGPSALILKFLSAENMAHTLGGRPASMLPIPLAPSFGRAAQAFKIASKTAAHWTSLRDFPDSRSKLITAEMLMTAALRGVAETAMVDTWTAPKSSHMPDGLVEIRIGSASNGTDSESPKNSGPAVWLRRQGPSWTSGRTPAPQQINARLTFDTTDTALGVLTGEISALKALGRGTVSIRGRVPMIQILFPLLDRFGEIMAWGRPQAAETVESTEPAQPAGETA